MDKITKDIVKIATTKIFYHEKNCNNYKKKLQNL